MVNTFARGAILTTASSMILVSGFVLCAARPEEQLMPLRSVTPQLRSRADAAVSRIKSDAKLSAMFERAMRANDVSTATRILHSSGLIEAGTIPVILPGPQIAKAGLPVSANPLWHCGLYFKNHTLPDGTEEGTWGFRCGWN